MGKSKDLATSSLSSDLTVDTDTFHVDVADNRVGVGIDAPLRKLHIRENAAVGEGIFISNEYNQAGTYSDLKWAWKASEGNDSYGSGLRFKQVDTTHGGQLEFYTDNASGTYTKQMQIGETGAVEKPNNPWFDVLGTGGWITFSANENQMTGLFSSGTLYQNTGGGFNKSNATYTAPVAGRYCFMWHTYTKGGSSGAAGSYIYPRLYKNGSPMHPRSHILHYTTGTNYDLGSEVTILADLAVNDTIVAGVWSNNTSNQYYGAAMHLQMFFVG